MSLLHNHVDEVLKLLLLSVAFVHEVLEFLECEFPVVVRIQLLHDVLGVVVERLHVLSIVLRLFEFFAVVRELILQHLRDFVQVELSIVVLVVPHKEFFQVVVEDVQANRGCANRVNPLLPRNLVVLIHIDHVHLRPHFPVVRLFEIFEAEQQEIQLGYRYRSGVVDVARVKRAPGPNHMLKGLRVDPFVAAVLVEGIRGVGEYLHQQCEVLVGDFDFLLLEALFDQLLKHQSVACLWCIGSFVDGCVENLCVQISVLFESVSCQKVVVDVGVLEEELLQLQIRLNVDLNLVLRQCAVLIQVGVDEGLFGEVFDFLQVGLWQTDQFAQRQNN